MTRQAGTHLGPYEILAIPDFGAQEGMACAVTERLDGETLRERVQRGALPVKKAIEVAGVYRQRWVSAGLGPVGRVRICAKEVVTGAR